MNRFLRASVLLSFALASACGHGPEPVAAFAPSAGEVEVEETDGRKLAVLPFPANGLVHVSVWIDAGSRDASSPALATLAAELAAEHAGPDVRAWVSPDGIELTTEGEADDLEALFARMGRALAMRRVNPDRLGAHVAALERRRERARADAGRIASELSLRALLGDSAKGLFPLGGIEDEPPRREAVETFLASHFGAERTLSVVAGDVERARARETWSSASRHWPRASSVRAEREALEGDSGVEVVVDREPAFAATALLPSIDTALAARRILEARAPARATTFAYAVRGGALLSLVADRPLGAEREMLHSMLRAIDAAGAGAHRSSWATSPREAAHQIGLRWSTRSAEAPDEVVVSLGAVVAGGRGDDLTTADGAPDRALAEQTIGRLEAHLAWARAAARPELEPAPSDPGFSRLSNGARLRVATTPQGSPVALSIAFESGVADEPPDVQGRAALVAEALAARCGRTLGGGSIVRPFVDEGAFGASVEGAPDGWTETATRFLACVLDDELDARSIEDARVALISRLHADPSAPTLAAVSRALAPSAPSLVWPLGTPQSVERVRLDGVSSVLERARTGHVVRAAMLGPVPKHVASRFLASALASLPEGTVARAPSPGTPLEGPIALRSETTFLVAAMRLPAGSASGARAYADACAEALRTAGHRVAFASGGGGRWGRWAAVRIDGSPTELAAFAQALRATRPSRERFEAHALSRERARRWAEGRPEAFGALAALGRSEAPDARVPEPSATVFVVGRAQRDEAYERLQDAN